MRIIRRLIIALIFMAGVLYLAENRAVVEFVWAPQVPFAPEPFASGRSVSMPLYLLLFFSMCIGIVLSAIGLLGDSAGKRLTIRRQKKQLDKVTKELSAARGEAAEMVAKADEAEQRAQQAENSGREAVRAAEKAERRALEVEQRIVEVADASPTEESARSEEPARPDDSARSDDDTEREHETEPKA